MLEQEDLISSTRRDYENLTKEMSKIQGENDSAKDEVKDVLQALEELAVNYDQKSQEAETKSREYNTVCEELSQKQSQLNSMQSELQGIKESATHQRKRINEMLRSLLTGTYIYLFTYVRGKSLLESWVTTFLPDGQPPALNLRLIYLKII